MAKRTSTERAVPAEFRGRMEEKVLLAAEAVLVAEGLPAVQVRRVAADAGCAIGTVYNLFGDLDGLLLAVNRRTLAALGTTLRAAQSRSAGDDLEARLMTLALAYLDFANIHSHRWRAIFEHRVPEGFAVPPAFFEERQGLLNLIEAEIASVTAGSPLAREDAARALFSATHGNVLLSLDGKLGPFEPERCARQLRFLVHTVVLGLVRL